MAAVHDESESPAAFDAAVDMTPAALHAWLATDVRRHLARRPDGDLRDTRWRWSLVNWGHDPLRLLPSERTT